MGGLEKKVGGQSLVHETFGGAPTRAPGVPGKRTLVEQLPPAIHPVQRLADGVGPDAPVQRIDAGYGALVAAARSAPVQRAGTGRIADADGGAVQQAAAGADHAAPAAPVATWTAPAGSRLEDPQLLALARRVRDPHLEALLVDLGGVLALNNTLRATRTFDTRYEIAAPDRARFVAGIGAVRAGLATLAHPTEADVAAFVIAVNHKLQEIAPYHFQLNIPTIETVGNWSTCNVTSLAMALEATGKGASSYPAADHPKLVAVARAYQNDIAQARLAASGTTPTIASLLGLRLPDFLEIAAVAEFISSAAPQPREIAAAGLRAVQEKVNGSFLKQLARKFGAGAESKTIQWDSTKTAAQNAASNRALSAYGSQHRGDGSHGVEQLSTARNVAEKETSPTRRAAAMRRYQTLLPAQQAALDGAGIERDLGLERYKSAVIGELGPDIDAGRGVMAGLHMHWTRLYGIDDTHILVQDPGAWNRTEINLTWAEARAMGYFWTNIVIS